MCGRFYVGGDFRDKLNELMEAECIAPASLVYSDDRQDVFPSNISTVICGNADVLSAVNMRWGFTNPYRKGLIINARSETAKEKKLFADSILNRRCVIPSSGFYEWNRDKARFRFTLPNNDLLLLAGFYQIDQGTLRYTILTTEANDSMRLVHDRMPVMIGASEIRPWIKHKDRMPEFLQRQQPRLKSEQESGQIRMDFEI